MDYILMIIFGIGLIALVAALVLTVRLILAKKEKRRKMKISKTAAVISALLVPTAVMAVIYCRPLIDQGEGITPFLEKLPSLTGRSYEECKEEYSDKFELIVEGEEYSFDYPAGTIIDQTPFEGSKYLPGNTTVKCVISKGVRMVTVSNVIGLDFDDAKKILEESTFTVGFVREYSDNVPKGKVIATDPPAGEKSAVWSTVKVTVSGGKEPDDTE